MTTLEIIRRETGIDATNETPLEDLVVDSLELVDLLLKIGDETGRDDLLQKIGSVQTVADLG